MPSSRRNARSTPTLGTAFMIWPIASSPHFWPMYVQSEWPKRYGKYLSGWSVSCSIVGSLPFSAASRIHVVVIGVLGPSDRYSAMPSANQSGGRYCASVWSPLPALPRAKMSYWNACTISCVSTCSKLAKSPVKLSSMR